MNSEEFFNQAISLNILSTDPNAHNYAGDFMFMGQGTAPGTVVFKNIDTRQSFRMLINEARKGGQ